MTTPSTTAYEAGDVVLVRFPFTDLSSQKRRPAVVLCSSVERRGVASVLSSLFGAWQAQ